MIQYSWVMKNVPDEGRGDLIKNIASALNQGFTLCASVGCDCVVQNDGEVLHEEVEAAGTLIHSGPRWRSLVSSLGEGTVKIDIYIEAPVYGHEVAEAEARLRKFNHPLFVVRTGGSI